MEDYKFPPHCTKKCQYFMPGEKICGYMLITGQSLLKEFGYTGIRADDEAETARISNEIRANCQHYQETSMKKTPYNAAMRRAKELNERRLELYQQGYTDAQIARMEGISLCTVTNWRSANKLPRNKVHSLEKIERGKRFLELYGQGCNDSEIAIRCSSSKSTVEKWRLSRGLPAIREETAEEYHARFLAAYWSSSCDEEIGKKVGKNKKTVQKYRTKHGLPPRSRR